MQDQAASIAEAGSLVKSYPKTTLLSQEVLKHIDIMFVYYYIRESTEVYRAMWHRLKVIQNRKNRKDEKSLWKKTSGNFM